MESHSNNPAEIVIREFRMGDYDAVIALWDEAQLPYRPEGRDRRDRIKNELKREDCVFLVAETEGRLVGSVLGTHDGRKGWINRLAVDSKFRGRNIAGRLVTEVETRLDSLGIEVFACLIEEENTDSMRVFERLGYERYSDIVYFSKRPNPEA